MTSRALVVTPSSEYTHQDLAHGRPVYPPTTGGEIFPSSLTYQVRVERPMRIFKNENSTYYLTRIHH
jgi:hypothetical protein